MSLFGDDSDAPSRPTNNKSSLFDDDDTAASSRNNNSIFADSAADESNDSPWGFTPSKRNLGGTRNKVKTLLADADVPDLYIDTFDRLQVGGFVSSREAKKLLEESGVGGPEREKIWSIVGQEERLGRGELSVLIALIGLAKEGEDLGLDAVDERRRKLPVPELPNSTAMPPKTPDETQTGARQESPHQTGTGVRKTSFGAGFGESDPWASPNMHKGHGHMNGTGAGQRTTSTFTTSATDNTESSSYSNGQSGNAGGTGSSWGGTSFAGGNTEGFGNAAATGEGNGFGDEGSGSVTARRPPQPRPAAGKGAEELVTVNLLEEKEGMFMFQHRNYEVASVRRNSKVIRRYSDFVWLLDCLHKRYPFRQLPLLPPKRVAINGNHIAADNGFIEKRRRGLARFANALVRHPILREEQLVVMFLTVPTVDARPLPYLKSFANIRAGTCSVEKAGHYQCPGRVRGTHSASNSGGQLATGSARHVRHSALWSQKKR